MTWTPGELAAAEPIKTVELPWPLTGHEATQTRAIMALERIAAALERLATPQIAAPIQPVWTAEEIAAIVRSTQETRHHDDPA